MDSDPVGVEASRPAAKMSRRRFLRNVAVAGGVGILGGTYGTQIEPFWLDLHSFPMTIARLPKSFEGFRIAHLSDLHFGDGVPADYLRSVMTRVNNAKPDYVVITGDVITRMKPDRLVAQRETLRGVLGELKAPVAVTFGNHEYGCTGDDWREEWDCSDLLEEMLRGLGHQVLRNQAVSINHADGRVWIVGLEDWFSGRFDPKTAFGSVGRKEPVIALSHNPDTAKPLDRYGPDWILAGHTHGGQVRIPGLGAPIVPISNRRFDAGFFQLRKSCLYVSRGVGYVKRIRLFCRPEVPIFVLEKAV